MSRSVAPADGLSTGNGPPPLVSQIAPKLLKLNANVVINSGPVATNSNGNVMVRKAFAGLAPSTPAASTRSDGMDCKAPVQTRNMYGKPIHNWMMSTAVLADQGWPNQSTFSPSALLIRPKSRLNMSRQTSSMANAGIAYGRISSER